MKRSKITNRILLFAFIILIFCINSGCNKKTTKDMSISSSSSVPVSSQSFDDNIIISGKYGYVDKGEYAMLAYYDDVDAVNIDIPAEINGLPVKELKEYLFSNCDKLVSVNIPSSINVIGNYVFVECSSLKKVAVPEGVKTINEGVFKYCSSLSEINLPKSLTRIEDYAFAGCIALESIYIPENVSFINEHAFSGCVNLKTSNVKLNIVTDTTYGITGTFPQCSSWTKDIIMSDKNNDGIYEAVINDLEPDVYEFKIRSNGEWTDSWGDIENGVTYNSQKNCSILLESKASVEVSFNTNFEDKKKWVVSVKKLD